MVWKYTWLTKVVLLTKCFVGSNKLYQNLVVDGLNSSFFEKFSLIVIIHKWDELAYLLCFTHDVLVVRQVTKIFQNQIYVVFYICCRRQIFFLFHIIIPNYFISTSIIYNNFSILSCNSIKQFKNALCNLALI